MRSRSTMTYAVAAATAATLTLAGCNGGDEEPTATPTATTSSTTSPSPSGSTSPSATSSPSPSVSISLPSAARANTEAGAIAFGKFFITSLDLGYVSQDPLLIEAMSAPNCGGCKGAVTVLKGLKSSNERQAKPAVTIAGAEYLPLNGEKVVDVFASYAAVDRIRNGKVIAKEPAHKTAYRLTVAWLDDGWKVAKTDVLGK